MQKSTPPSGPAGAGDQNPKKSPAETHSRTCQSSDASSASNTRANAWGCFRAVFEKKISIMVAQWFWTYPTDQIPIPTSSSKQIEFSREVLAFPTTSSVFSFVVEVAQQSRAVRNCPLQILIADLGFQCSQIRFSEKNCVFRRYFRFLFELWTLTKVLASLLIISRLYSNYQSLPAVFWVIFCDYLLRTLFNPTMSSWIWCFYFLKHENWKFKFYDYLRTLYEKVRNSNIPTMKNQRGHFGRSRSNVVIIIGLDTLVKYVILCMVGRPRMLMSLGLAQTQQVINRFIYLKGNIMSSFGIEQVSIHLYK